MCYNVRMHVLNMVFQAIKEYFTLSKFLGMFIHAECISISGVSSDIFGNVHILSFCVYAEMSKFKPAI